MQTILFCALIGAVLALPATVAFGIPHPNGEVLLFGAKLGALAGGLAHLLLSLRQS